MQQRKHSISPAVQAAEAQGYDAFLQSMLGTSMPCVLAPHPRWLLSPSGDCRPVALRQQLLRALLSGRAHR
eukprot:CAMPEP_0174304634 /NCGR_PEP_ID=MMETSP0809-20121228/60905_1 /TAXON_ID=73025 ORGANISM="Eutreptiella gymnastica-like, Strain CCMP1594" /NCGR_SAMPLE_ID=MMETSP0809 /ASSEMBLY_ACC=CAM_ASM_000658 /LENGTH=70 /DNA_ID=CAMNT_0015410903 /DNA_START=2475 /DNA_END=2687 /DNA_ORIENTATION=-